VSAPILLVDDVTVRFGGNQALSGVTLDVAVGTLTGLIGPNGAGKTTLFNVITGVQPPSTGRVLLDGRDVSRLGTHRRARLGVGRTFQRLELFHDLSVRDNLRVAAEIRNAWRPLAARSERLNPRREADRVIELIGLADVADAAVAEVPTGVARKVEVGRALVTKPRLLLLDEPASGQSEDETQMFGELLVRLAAQGLSILLVEHDMTLVMDVCQRIHVLEFGQLIATGSPDDLRHNQLVLDAYLGA
jgi:branched-chain amino acid transport system ATP-binding protein